MGGSGHDTRGDGSWWPAGWLRGSKWAGGGRQGKCGGFNGCACCRGG